MDSSLAATVTANSLASCILFLLTVALILVVRHEHERKSLPPGPRGIPIVGNVFDVPQEQPWATFSNLSRRYGDVICISILGQITIVLNSISSVSDLLEKRSSIYSTRPNVFVSISQALDWIWGVVFKPYGDDWRLHRRLLWRFFQPNTIMQWQSTQTREARHLLLCLLEDSSDLKNLIKLSLCRSLLSVSHGLPATRLGQQLLDDPFDAAQDAMSRGDASPSILNQLLDAVPESQVTGVTEVTAKEISAAVFAAGADTTIATMTAFFCAIILYPDVQTRAQEELDAVVGPDRLPQITDLPSLPYVKAVVKELLRWHSAAPLSLPHGVTKEDEYRGWRIPCRATVIMNIWGILHDPELWPDPDAFLPDRFMKDGSFNDEVFDPANIAFSAGRRTCPGKHYAEASLFINIASVLHTFNIMPAVDERGLPVPVEHKVTTGIVSTVEPFEYSIRPRSEAAEALIRDSTRLDCA
ncbi:hypothetical protein ONZ51_g5256 [Trametes cubensis]|uniref:Cytochrome P450 n=1 Tax=Trametes cubensis TaxID=1111947 RepID=A0AAD7XC95_9APHY|nr:hypothetical protein ONZ51_g5256 [Trametes cubensis]